MPTASRVAVLSNPANSYTALLIEETEAAARSLRVRVQPLAVGGAADLDGAFSAITKERPSARTRSMRRPVVINLKTAKALGLTIPPPLLQRADQVIE